MARVLHVIPRDATLACYGLEAWADAGRGFLPVFAALAPTGWAERGDRWDLFAVHPLAEPEGIARWAARLRASADPLTRLVETERVGLIHVHDPAAAADVLRTADRLDLPVVATCPGQGGFPVSFERFDHVLAPSPARADWVRQRSRGRAGVRLAPPPIQPPEGNRRGRGDAKPLRWVTAVTDGERAHLGMVARAFARHAVLLSEVPELTVIIAGAWTREARLIVDAYAPGAAVRVVRLSDGEGVRAAIAAAHLGVFPLAGADGARGEGLTWPAWVAAGLGLPLVLGRPAAELDGFRDHQQALLAEPEERLIGERMHFLATRPYIWPTLGAAARKLATGRLMFERACEIPFEVYREVLREHVRAIS